jgi:hypothetical protein
MSFLKGQSHNKVCEIMTTDGRIGLRSNFVRRTGHSEIGRSEKGHSEVGRLEI